MEQQIDIARIKRNVAKMASMGAPEADIDGYIASEGTTIDAVRNHKMYVSQQNAAKDKLIAGTPSMAESGVRGFGSGATMGFSDEIMGAIGGAVAKYTPEWMGGRPDLFKGRSYADVYREGRDMARRDEAAAAEANPITYGTAALAGGLLTASKIPVATPFKAETASARIGNAAATGAGYGAVAGAGTGKSDLTRGDVGGFIGDTATGAVVGGLIGGGLQSAFEAPQAIVKAGQAAAKKFSDVYMNFGGGGVNKAMKTDFAREGARLENQFGIKFSAAEKTANRRAEGLEDLLANKTQTADRVFAAQKTKIDKLTKEFNGFLGRIYKRGTSELSAGQRIQGAYNKIVNDIRKTRRDSARMDFKLAHEMAGGKPLITPTKTAETIQSFIDEASGNLATPAQKAAARQAQDLLKRLTQTRKTTQEVSSNPAYLNLTPPKPQTVTQKGIRDITIKDLQAGLHTFGDAGKSTGGLWRDISTAGDRRFANAMYSALRQDMDDAIAAGNKNPMAIEALGVARDRYAQFSNQLDDIQNTVVGKFIGTSQAPEDIAKKVTRLQPSEVKQMFSLLDDKAPDVANSTRRYMLENAMEKAASGRGQLGQGLSEPLNLPAFLKALPDDNRLSAIFNDPRAAKEVRDITAAFNRIQRFGGLKGGSPTYQRGDVQSAAIDAIDWKNPAWYMNMMVKIGKTDAYADALLNDGVRKALAYHSTPQKVTDIIRAISTKTPAVSKRASAVAIGGAGLYGANAVTSGE